jgi:hypothetical protein
MNISGPIALNAMAAIRHALGYRSEIQCGQVAVLEALEFEDDVVTDYGVYGAPSATVTGEFWDRDIDLFGPPLIAPPIAIIGSSYTPAPQIEAPEVKESEPEPEPVKAVKSPFDRYRPADPKKAR